MVEQDPAADRAPADKDATPEPASTKGERTPQKATPPPPPPPRPPRDFALLFPLLMARGVLDGVDLCTLACCSSELRLAVEAAWVGICARDPTVVLRSVARPVDDPALNKVKHGEYAPVSEAGPCVVCKNWTRYRHPVAGPLLCATCGTQAESHKPTLPVHRFAMTTQSGAYGTFGVAKDADLRLLLRWTERRTEHNVQCASTSRYAPARAPSLKDVIPKFGVRKDVEVYSHRHGGGRVVESRWADLPRPPADLYKYDSAQPVFLRREIVCLLLERYGGPLLLTERLLNRDLPYLNPNAPDA
jgi:hypothetical protein